MDTNINELKKALNPLNKVKRYLDKAIIWCSIKDIYIPEDFIYKEEFKKIPSQLELSKTTITETYKLLDSQIIGFENADNKNNNIASQIGENITPINPTINSNSNYILQNLGVDTLNSNGTINGFDQTKYSQLEASLIKNGIKNEAEASKVLQLMSNDKNINTYAKISEGIINRFKANPLEFERQFGYPLFNGEKVNAEKLYADLFVRANFGRLLIRDSSGQTIVNPNKNGTELSEIELKNILKNYLKTKNISELITE